MSDNHVPLHAAKWFEIPSPDLAASQNFYESVLARSLRRGVMGPSTIEVFPYAANAPLQVQEAGFRDEGGKTLADFLRQVRPIDAAAAARSD